MTIRRLVGLLAPVLFLLIIANLLLNWLSGDLLARVAENAVADRTLSCSELPSVDEVEAVMGDNPTAIERIEALNRGFMINT